MKSQSLSRWSTLIIISILLLQVPAIYYSINTPFQIVDDISVSLEIKNLESIDKAATEFSTIFFGTGRFMPVWNVYTYLTYGLFGTNAPLHHLARLLLKLLTAMVTIKALMLFIRRYNISTSLPLIVFSVIYLFYPNNPEARLVPQEPLLVLFLSICLYYISVLVNQYNGDLTVLPINSYIRLFAAFLFMLWSKENSLFLGLAIIISLTLLNFNRKSIKVLLPFVLFFIYSGIVIYLKSKTANYGVTALTAQLIKENAKWYTVSLFLQGTSNILSVLLTVPLVAYPLIFYWKRGENTSDEIKAKTISIGNYKIDGLIIYFAIALMLSISFYGWILTAFLSNVVRYIYPLAYLLSILIAISLLGITRYYRLSVKTAGMILLTCLFFICVNYYNFLYQYASQYANGMAWKNSRNYIMELRKNGNKVFVAPHPSGLDCQIISYFNEYLPYYYNAKDMRVIDIGENPGTFTLNEGKKALTLVNYPPGSVFIAQKDAYLPTVQLESEMSSTGGVELLKYKLLQRIDPLSELLFLKFAKDISSICQFGKIPYIWYDAGAFPISGYGWSFYEAVPSTSEIQTLSFLQNISVPLNDDMSLPLPQHAVFKRTSMYYFEFTYVTSGNAAALFYLQDKNTKLYIHTVLPKFEKYDKEYFSFSPEKDIKTPLLFIRNHAKKGTIRIKQARVLEIKNVFNIES